MKYFSAIAFAAVLVASSPAFAQDTLIGGKAGGSFNQLSRPADPAGEPTVLFGTSFTGFGFQAGATIYRELTTVGPGPLFLAADVLYSYQRGSGFAESRTSPARRTVTISTSGLRVPLLLGLGFAGKGSMLNLAVGPELMLGLAASSTTEQEGGASGSTLLPVRSVTHVGVTSHLGMIFEVGAARLPIDLRFTWDPFVAKSTRDRFDNYVDFDNTGDYAVAFTWQGVVMVGVMFDVFSSSEPYTPAGEPEPVDEPEPVEEPEPEPDEDPDFG